MIDLKVKYPKCKDCGKKLSYFMLNPSGSFTDGFYCNTKKCRLFKVLRLGDEK